ncbi:hypothetical protein AVEN_257267-1 [Araneus ventricosus]|uniref:Reverse transcriptase domain-containing protein n=1 Tax=Araneus ventricosus TaxID=182803 RepID=A0A4Y2HBK0_ARAVE|nr:hypothetical protein AVEN_257267-1 [Araneus ventricosus]
MFPNPLDYADVPTIRTNTPDDVPFTKEEIPIFIKNLHKGKAPGPDGTDNIIIEQISKQKISYSVHGNFKKCLHLGTFPDPIKLDNNVLYKKEGKPDDEASSYRPTSLLKTIGKVLEKLLTQRLKYHPERLNKIGDKQYGFRDERSTELAIHHLIQKSMKAKRKILMSWYSQQTLRAHSITFNTPQLSTVWTIVTTTKTYKLFSEIYF